MSTFHGNNLMRQYNSQNQYQVEFHLDQTGKVQTMYNPKNTTVNSKKYVELIDQDVDTNPQEIHFESDNQEGIF